LGSAYVEAFDLGSARTAALEESAVDQTGLIATNKAVAHRLRREVVADTLAGLEVDLGRGC
jgi:hypothetical protein